jgi:TPR repeat protein
MLGANKRKTSPFEVTHHGSHKTPRAVNSGRKPFGDLLNNQPQQIGVPSAGGSIYGNLFCGLKGYPPAKALPTGPAPPTPAERASLDQQHSALVLTKRAERAVRCGAINLVSPEENRRSAVVPGAAPQALAAPEAVVIQAVVDDCSEEYWFSPVRQARRESAHAAVPAARSGLTAAPKSKASKKNMGDPTQRKPQLPGAFKTPATQLQRLEAAHAANLKVHVGVVALPGGGGLAAAPAVHAASSASLPPPHGVAAGSGWAARARALDLRWAAWLLRTDRVAPAARLGHPEAMATLAERLLLGCAEGRGCSPDSSRPSSCSPATPEAIADILGRNGSNGSSSSDDDDDADPEAAVQWAAKAAAAGDKGGQRLLGLAYRHGLGGLRVNFKLAAAQFEAASLQGCGASMANLAWLLTVGSPPQPSPSSRTTPRLPTQQRDDGYLAPSPHRAFWWYLQAAQSGSSAGRNSSSAAKAAAAVSRCYAGGLGVARDAAAAACWAALARKQGHVDRYADRPADPAAAQLGARPL